jgi:hypothetical protein
MRAIVKVFVVGTLGLAVLLGSSAVSLALPKLIGGKTYCLCTCFSKQTQQREDLGWEKVGGCSGANGKACSFTSGGKKVSGELLGCWQCTADANSGCTASGASAYRAPGGLTVAPGDTPPSPTTPSDKLPHPGGIQGR